MKNKATKQVPKIPSKFPFAVGDVVILERQTLYQQPTQSFKKTTRTIKEINVNPDRQSALVRFKESDNLYRLSLGYDGGAYVSNRNSRYELHYKNGKPFAWHNIPPSQLD